MSETDANISAIWSELEEARADVATTDGGGDARRLMPPPAPIWPSMRSSTSAVPAPPIPGAFALPAASALLAQNMAPEQRAALEAARKEQDARAREEQEYRERSLAQGVFHDGIGEQVHYLYCLNGRPRLAADDLEHGSRDPREKCEEGVCVGAMHELRLYAVQPEDEQDELLDHLRRQKTAREMYISERALDCAVRCGMLAGERFRRTDGEMQRRREEQSRSQKSKIDHSPYNVLVHACVESFCTLSSTATKAQRELYEKIHEQRITGPNVVRYIFFCKRHVRFHICDQHCDQTRGVSGGSGTLCILSAMVKTGVPLMFAFEDGTGTEEQRDARADLNTLRDTRETNDAELDGLALNPSQKIDIRQRRKAAFGGVTIIRDRSNRTAVPSATGAGGIGGVAGTTTGAVRGVGRRRGRGRGRGSIAGGGNRQQMARLEMAASLTKSSGDADSTMTPQDEATKYAQIVSYSNGYSSSVASRDTIAGKMGIASVAPPSSTLGVSGVAGSGSVTSRKRKLSRARRWGAAQATPSIKITLDVPRYLIEVDESVESVANRNHARPPSTVIRPKAEVKAEVKSEPSARGEDPLIDEYWKDDEQPIVTAEHSVAQPVLPVTGVKSETDHLLKNRLSVPVLCAYELQQQQQQQQSGNMMMVRDGATGAIDVEAEENNDDDILGDTVTVSFDLQPSAPFAERRQNAHDRWFVIDTLQVARQHNERLARFHLPRSLVQECGNTFFSTNELFEVYGERACSIVWRLLFSKERGAIERDKASACMARARGEVSSYVTKQLKENRVCSAERAARLCSLEYDRASISKTLVIDLELCKMLETLFALYIIEFYVNLISLPRQLCLHLDEATDTTIKARFRFEDFVPAILKMMSEGLTVKNIMMLPNDCLFVSELFPETNTMKLMGMPEQTMTHLQTTIRTYIASADRSKVSMRRFEGTHIDWQELVRMRAPGYIEGTELMEPSQRADYLAHQVVCLFVKRRSARLKSFGHFYTAPRTTTAVTTTTATTAGETSGAKH